MCSLSDMIFLMSLPLYESVHIKHKVAVRKLVFTTANTSEKKKTLSSLVTFCFVAFFQKVSKRQRQEETYKEGVGGEKEVM